MRAFGLIGSLASQAEATRQFLIDRVGKRFEDIETDQHEDQIAAGTLPHCASLRVTLPPPGILVPEDLDIG